MFAFVVGERNTPQASLTLHLVGRSQYMTSAQALAAPLPLPRRSRLDVSLSDVHALGVTV